MAPAATRGAWQCAQQADKKGTSWWFLHLMQAELLLEATGERWRAQEAPNMGNRIVRGSVQAAKSCLCSGSAQWNHF